LRAGGAALAKESEGVIPRFGAPDSRWAGGFSRLVHGQSDAPRQSTESLVH